MTPLLKIGTGVLTIGTIAGVSYAGSTYFMNKKEVAQNPEEPKPTIRQLIEKDFDYILLNTEATGTDDSAHWKTNWESYKSANDDALKLEGWSTRGDKDLTDKLKEKCASLATNTDDTIRVNVTKYCGRGVTIEDEAKRDKLVIIETNNPSADNTTWKSKIDKKEQLQKHLSELSITDTDLTAEKLRQQCKATITKKRQESKYKETYLAYKEVCTKLEGEA